MDVAAESEAKSDAEECGVRREIREERDRRTEKDGWKKREREIGR